MRRKITNFSYMVEVGNNNRLMASNTLMNFINTIRMLSADFAVGERLGQPPSPIWGAAAFPYTLWMKHCALIPANPDWLNRD